MSKQRNDDTTNNTQRIVYSIVGASVCCYFKPDYTIYFVLYGVMYACAYGIISVLKKYEKIEDINFVEKEKVEYFRNKSR